MSERAAILGRIREALRVAAPKPGSHIPGSRAALAGARVAATAAREWLPNVGPEPKDWMDCFTRNASELKTRFILAGSEAEAAEQLAAVARENAWRRVATHPGGLAARAAAATGLPVFSLEDGYAAQSLESCDAGITGCDALVAQTGSIVLTARSGGGRALSVLPPHHVVIARRAQLVPDLPAAFSLLHGTYGPADWPSLITLITGPSRTGDIERILVLGAHGPKQLTVILF